MNTNKIYITGVSGTGKTTLAKLLIKRGINAYSIDEIPGLCHWVNKINSQVVDHEAKLDRAFINSHSWICDIKQLKNLISQQGLVVVLGLADNQNEFLPLFDKVILLQCRPETFLKRIIERKDNVFGQDETSQEYLRDFYKKFENKVLKNGAATINVEESIGNVIDKVIRKINQIKLEDLGYSEFFEKSRKSMGLEGFLVARVIAEHKGSYRVKNETGEYMAKVTGKQVFNAKSREDYPAVGDFVAITVLDSERAVIEAVLPRKTIIKRQQTGKNEIQIIASNIDTAFIVEAVDRDYNLNRLERYFAIASTSNIEVVIILNKIDLISKENLEIKLTEIKQRFPGVVVITTSNISDTGLTELKEFIKKGITYSFLGSSGVGKSSLINKLLGVNTLRTEDISLYSGRGKHITTSREMYFLPALRSLGEVVGGIVIDNPGMREVGVTESTASIDAVFEEITALARECKYSDCTHTHEPGCAVLEAVNDGKLDRDKYKNFLNLKKETGFNKLTALEKREKNKKFGKFIKKAKQDLKRYGM